MAEKPEKPWLREEGESGQAYTAFRVYLKLGRKRTVAAAYRLKTGRKDAKMAASDWRAWAVQYRWKNRARSYDNHRSAQRQKGIDQAITAGAVKWERRKRWQADRDFRSSKQLASQADLLAKFPVVRQWDENGTTVIEPIEPDDLKTAAAIREVAAKLAWGAIDRALDDDDDDFDPTNATPDECRAWMERQVRRRKARGGGG